MSTKIPPGHPTQLSLRISEVREELIDPEIRARLVEDLAQLLISQAQTAEASSNEPE